MERLLVVALFPLFLSCSGGALETALSGGSTASSFTSLTSQAIDDVSAEISWTSQGEINNLSLHYKIATPALFAPLHCNLPGAIQLSNSTQSTTLSDLEPNTAYSILLCANQGEIQREASFTTLEYCHGDRLTNSPFANSNEPGIDGSDPDRSFTICTASQMNSVGSDISNVSKSFKLMKDIDISALIGTTFNLIGSATNRFTGSFDGNGYSLDGFTYDDIGLDNAGLFREIDAPAVIKNITLSNVDVNLMATTGVLVGNMLGGTIENVKITDGFMRGRWSCHSGLVGGMSGGTISQVSVRVHIEAIDGYTGGIVGCMADASIDQASYVGNIAGVSGFSDYIGGIAGYIGGASRITNAYARGAMTGTGDGWGVGGLIGGAESTCSVENTFAAMTINVPNYADNSGPVSHSIGELGGMASHPSNYSDATLACPNCNQINGTELTSGPNFQQSDFSAFDFNSIWKFDGVSKFPELRFE